MPPRARAKNKKYDDYEDDFEDSGSDFDPEAEEEEVKPKKKRAAPAKKGKAAPKRKAKEEVTDSEEEDSEEDEEVVVKKQKPKKPRAPPAPKATEITVLDDGWTVEPPSLIYKAFGEDVKSAKIACLDLDGTITQTASGAQFPTNADDWSFLNANVPTKVKGYHEAGYKIAIFTNQGGIKSALLGKASENFRGRVNQIVKALGVPVVVIAATQADNHRKPNTGMWDVFKAKFMGGVEPDIDASFFVGDNIDGGDEGFANNLGLPYRSEAQEFGASEVPKPHGGGGDGPNAELVGIFGTLADLAKKSDPAKGGFKANALRKAALALADFPRKIQESDFKEVKGLKGIGDSSMKYIKEYVATGRVASAEMTPEQAVAAKAAAEGGPGAVADKRAEGAMAFL